MNRKSKHNGNIIFLILVLLLAVLLFVGIFSPFIVNWINNALGTDIAINTFDSTFLVTVIASVATLSSILFAIYGWFTISELPEKVDKSVEEQLKKSIYELNEKINKSMEATQKINAAYGIKDSEQKIELLKDVLEIYPETYNARITIAYTYWYDKKDTDLAIQWFEKEIEINQDNYAAYCDLAALYSELKEYSAATQKAKKAIQINDRSKQVLLSDSRVAEEVKKKL